MGIGSEITSGWGGWERPASKGVSVFFAHPSSYGLEQQGDEAIAIYKFFCQTHEESSVYIRTGSDDFTEYFQGDWDGWCRQVVDRIQPLDGSPRYTVFITPVRTLGKATASILGRALENGREVYLYQENGGEEGDKGELVPVSSIRETDKHDYISGWEIQT